jgi:hypothetical protein
MYVHPIYRINFIDRFPCCLDISHSLSGYSFPVVRAGLGLAFHDSFHPFAFKVIARRDFAQEVTQVFRVHISGQEKCVRLASGEVTDLSALERAPNQLISLFPLNLYLDRVLALAHSLCLRRDGLVLGPIHRRGVLRLPGLLHHLVFALPRGYRGFN